MLFVYILLGLYFLYKTLQGLIQHSWFYTIFGLTMFAMVIFAIQDSATFDKAYKMKHCSSNFTIQEEIKIEPEL